MKQKLQKISDQKWLPAVILVFVIIVQLGLITDAIVNRKQGYHSDEIFSYGLANNYYSPFIDADSIQDYSDEHPLKNVNGWISADVLREYITVQPGEQFCYDSVWYNLSRDRHQPLYPAVLHTVCSFFPDTFSPWFGYSINYLCFIVTQIFLYKLARNMLKSRYLALLVCTLWGFSAGAVNLTIFIRMYCMLAMWTVILFSLHAKLYSTKEKPLLRQLVPITLVTACGTLTQILFLFPAFVIAAWFCIRYLITKRFRVMLAYGGSMLGGVALAVCCFPAAVAHVIDERNNAVHTNFPKQFRLAFKYFFDEIFPVDSIEIILYCKILLTLAVTAAVLAVPILFLLRDKPQVQGFLSALRNLPKNALGRIRSFRFKKALHTAAHGIRHANPITAVIVLSVTLTAAVTAYTIRYSIGYVDRYLFILFPVFAAGVVSVICFVLSGCRYKKTLTALLLIFTIFIRMPMGNLSYLFVEEKTLDSLSELTDGADCIFVVNAKSDAWLINTYPVELYHADQVFVTWIAAGMREEAALEKLSGDCPVYLFVDDIPTSYDDNGDPFYYYVDEEHDNAIVRIDDDKLDEELYSYYRGLSISDTFRSVGRYTIFSHTYNIYQIRS